MTILIILVGGAECEYNYHFIFNHMDIHYNLTKYKKP